jgi:cell division protein FtsW
MVEARAKTKKKPLNSYRKRLKQKSYKEADFALLSVTIALVLFGLLMVYSASSYENVTKGIAANKDVIRQGIFAILGLGFMILIVSNIDYHLYSKQVTNLILFITISLNLAVILFEESNGASRWIKLGGFSFQPSELAKFVMVLYAANALKRVETFKKKSWRPILKVFAVTGILSGIIIVLQSNLSIGAIVAIIALLLIFLSGASFIQVALPVMLGGGALLMALLLKPYRLQRLLSFSKPFEDAQGSGHQLVQSLYALTSGGVFGRGIGMSRLKALWLPEANNDFIFAVIVEELGFIGGIVLILLILILISRGIKIALHAKDNFGRLLAVGITGVFALQSLINIAVVIGAFPVTGVTLPFISAGGTSLFVNLTAVGVLMNISKQKPKAKRAANPLKPKKAS